MKTRDNLIQQLATVQDWVERQGIELPEDFSKDLDGLKTAGHFRRVLRKAVLDFWRGDTDAFAFIDGMIYVVEDQLRRAWNEGMRAVGLKPKEDMTPEWQSILDGVIGQQLDHVLNFAQAVQDTKDEDKPIEPLYARVELWVNRYNEVVNLAKTTTGGAVKLIWALGRTEKHCSTCFALSGIIAFSHEWKASGYKPQAAPNPMLECGGWRCDCSLKPTNRYRTRGGIPNV